jgi:hypothetical protein
MAALPRRRPMRPAVVLLLAVLLALPLASARGVCQGNVCVGDQNEAQGSCETRGSETHKTGVFAGSVIEAGGTRECGTFDDGSYEQTTVGVLVRGPPANGYGNNYGVRVFTFTTDDSGFGHYEGTFLIVNVVLLESNVGLTPSYEPVDPGWGHLLP